MIGCLSRSLFMSIVACFLIWHTEGFHIISSRPLARFVSPGSRNVSGTVVVRPRPLFSAEDEKTDMSDSNPSWNPTARKLIAGLSGVGAVETGYLSYTKLFVPGGIDNICGESSSSAPSCSNVLNSPYANVHIGSIEVPLTLLGFAAYATVTMLSALPIFKGDNTNHPTDDSNRIAILAMTTAMATFSTFLISLLFNVLHQSCPYCLLSAGISLSMGLLAWTSGALPPQRRQDGAKVGLGSFVTATFASLALFLSVDETVINAYSNDIMQENVLSNGIVALADESKKDIPPPPITASSSERALKIGQDLKSLDAKMFGAYWCSHCYEQKQRLGKEAYMNVQYIECSKEGLNSKTNVCKEKKIPGYPTWEINGNLYPGDMYLDELEDIIENERKKVQI